MPFLLEIEEKSKTVAQHIRVNHREPDNLIWFYRMADHWLVEFGVEENTRMNARRIYQEGWNGLLGEYQMLHEWARGAQDPAFIEHV